ncbi:protein kinase [bacterium]|nr:protein kinase [candidate division CSSED10-310 bacterium]
MPGNVNRRQVLPGAVLRDCVVGERLGAGFLGRTFEGYWGEPARRVAIKVFRSGIRNMSGFEDRWASLLPLVQARRHDGLISVHTGGVTDDHGWYAMDLAPGAAQNIRTVGDLAHREGGILEASQVIGLLGYMLHGLAHLHGSGMVHGNLTPASVLLYRLPDGRVISKLGDFGLVPLVGLDEYLDRIRGAVATSMRGRVPVDGRGDSVRALLRTREYLAPEIQRGGALDFRADIYSIGLMVYRLISGARLSPRPPSHFNPALNREHDRFILRALEPDPVDRYADAGAMLDALEPVRELVNRQLEVKRRQELARSIGDVRGRAARLVVDGRLEEARDMLRELMERHPGREDILEDYSAVEDRIVEHQAVANQEEQYYWDSIDARQMEADGNVEGALKVWTILSKLFPHKEEAHEEVQRLYIAAGRFGGSMIEDQETAGELDSLVSEVTQGDGAVPGADRLGDRIDAYRRARNRAWDLADNGRNTEALDVLAELRREYADRPELVEELALIEEEIRDVRDAEQEKTKRYRNRIVIAIVIALGVTAIGIIGWVYYGFN